MREKRIKAELSKSLKQMENPARESGDAPQAYILFPSAGKALKFEKALSEIL